MNPRKINIGDELNHEKLGVIIVEGIKKHFDDYAIFTNKTWVYLKNCTSCK